MRQFRRQSDVSDTRRPSLVEELELLLRRMRGAVFLAPLLLLMGFGVGKSTSRTLSLPENVSSRTKAAPEAATLHLDALSGHLAGVQERGVRTAEYVELYTTHVKPVEDVLRRRGVPAATARQVAWPLVEQSHRRGLDPATVLSVLLVESRGRPRATSPVGARGLMQVMPLWAGRWRGCGRDLYDIEGNLCHGTNILAYYLRRAGGDERRALLAYNGCVRGTNTPNCFRYPDTVQRLRRQIQAELAAAAPSRSLGAAAAP